MGRNLKCVCDIKSGYENCSWTLCHVSAIVTQLNTHKLVKKTTLFYSDVLRYCCIIIMEVACLQLIQFTVCPTVLILLFILQQAFCSLLVAVLLFVTDTHCLFLFKCVLVCKVLYRRTFYRVVNSYALYLQATW
jgi:hypothetical protein